MPGSFEKVLRLKDWHSFIWQSPEIGTCLFWSTIFRLRTRIQYFNEKLPFLKSVSRQIEWGLQHGPMGKKRILPLIALLSENLIWVQKSLNVPTTQMSVFMLSVRTWVLFESVFPPLVSLNHLKTVSEE